MRDRDANQTVEEAKDLVDKFVRKQFMEAKRLIKEGKRKEAYIEFSIGLHTLQDATSISHNDFQPWSIDDPLLSKAVHVTNDLYIQEKKVIFKK